MKACIPPARIEEFTRDWNAGVVVRKMADKYGCSPSTVTLTARRLGFPKRPSGRRTTEADFALRDGAWVIDPRRRILVWKAAA